ncbi:hypothetical protein, partial [Burkholderia pseudomallei]|uniref:hypothetical protein n=1 Tax=Burkholderia pseudomallei TaxID=28450 RepID=UPI0019D357EA
MSDMPLSNGSSDAAAELRARLKWPHVARTRRDAPDTTRGYDLPDFFGPFQSWRTASVASVEQYRCLNSSG